MASGLVTAVALAAPSAVAAPAPQVTAAQLADASSTMRTADVAGTAWYTDKATGKIVVTADSSVSAAELNKVKSALADTGAGLTVKRTPGTFSKLIAGGEAITTGGARCSSASTSPTAAPTTR